MGNVVLDEIALLDQYGLCSKRVADWIEWANGTAHGEK